MAPAESLAQKFKRLREEAEEREGASFNPPAAPSLLPSGPSSSRKRNALDEADQDPKDSIKNDEDAAEFQQMMKRYKIALDSCREAGAKRQQELADFKANLAYLRGAYLYGLKKVFDLKDLQNAPDAIMEGNFPKETVVSTKMAEESSASTGNDKKPV